MGEKIVAWLCVELEELPDYTRTEDGPYYRVSLVGAPLDVVLSPAERNLWYADEDGEDSNCNGAEPEPEPVEGIVYCLRNFGSREALCGDRSQRFIFFDTEQLPPNDGIWKLCPACREKQVAVYI